VARKRRPGAGRKPKPDKKVMFSVRLDPGVLAALRAGARTWPGNVSTFTEFLLERALREREEERRDPKLRALLYFIAQIAEWSGAYGMTVTKELEKRLPKLWHTDRLSFRTFKVAVEELLHLMVEPPVDPVAHKGRGQNGKPEDLAVGIIDTLWLRAVSDKYAHRVLEGTEGTAKQRMQDEIYGLRKAMRDLGIPTHITVAKLLPKSHRRQTWRK